MRRETVELAVGAEPACVGRVVEITAGGEVLVDYPGNKHGPMRARLAAPTSIENADEPVLLVFENGDLRLPVVAGIIRETNAARPSLRNELVLEAMRQITLVCGKSSITLHRDGRIIVKGADILSRASGKNKIRGASVAIN
jgi:hypothetical protein